MKNYSIATQKGGVGKTTTADTFTAILARRGKRVLLVDVDPQANASKRRIPNYFSIPVHHTLYSVIVHKQPITKELIHKSNIPNLDVLASHIKMSGADLELATAIGNREERLKRALAPIEKDYDYIIFDCPPALSFLTLNAFTASDRVVLMVSDGADEVDALIEIVNTLSMVKEENNPNLDVAGILYCMADQRTKLHDEIRDQILDSDFGDYLLDTVIPRSVKIKEAAANHLDIEEYAPDATVTLQYIRACVELELLTLQEAGIPEWRMVTRQERRQYEKRQEVTR